MDVVVPAPLVGSRNVESSVKPRTRIASVCLMLAACVYAVLVYLAARHHEPWADEAQAWLIARDSSLVQIWTRMAPLEGTPMLWHSLLHGLIRFGVHYSGLNVVSGLLGLLAAIVFLRYAPFPILLRICVPFTYFSCYQYAVVARNYSLAPFLLFSTLAAYHGAAPIGAIAILLVALASVSAQAYLLSVALGCVIAVGYMRDWKQETVRRRIQIVLSGAGCLLAFVLLAYAVWPRAGAVFVVSPNVSLANFFGVSRYAFNQAFGEVYVPHV